MNQIAKIVSLVALGLVVVPGLVYFVGEMNLATVKWTALAGTVVWFLATPFWMSRKLPVDAAEVEI